MAITKAVRDQLLVQARHRCTVCAEKCFELHHIIEKSEGGGDNLENLIVLCPNCHQHRYHRSKEFTPNQLRLYKQQLKDQNEIEKRLLQNLEEILKLLPTASPEDIENRLKVELQEAAAIVSPEKSPGIYATIQQTSEWLAERDLIRGGARRAIEIEWEIRKEQEKRKYPEIKIKSVDDNALRKAPDFPCAFYLEFMMDRRPNSDWVKVFMAEWEMSPYDMKRKTRIQGDRIVVVVPDSDNLQEYADRAKRLVESTNKRVHTLGFQRIDQIYEQQKRTALEHFDAIQSMKARTRNIKI